MNTIDATREKYVDILLTGLTQQERAEIPTSKEMNRWFFDIESFPNFFSVIFYDGSTKLTFTIASNRNDILQLILFLQQVIKDGDILIGYNSIGYDNILLNYLLAYYTSLSSYMKGDEIAGYINIISKGIIEPEKASNKVKQAIRNLKYSTRFKFIDLLEVIREGFNVKGLKGVAINLKWHRIQDLPHSPDHIVLLEEIDDILDYNFNDVLITERVYNHISQRIVMREVLSERYGVNLLSDADSMIAKTIFNKAYGTYEGVDLDEIKHKRTSRKTVAFADIIFPWVKFETPELQVYLEELRKVVVTDVDTDKPQVSIPPLVFNGMEYTIALGGIHSVDKPGMFESNEDMMLMDMDVASQYPSCILHNKVCPAHLDPNVFLDVYQGQVDLRLDYKAKGKYDKFAKIVEAGLKIEINTV